ncbi:MAG TPA: hypothetical protein VFJ94_16215 [Intrasporangium sp.]|uniref:hypothetical protein n=1 Tax=Intrasporangium sp. TaxID=1925024 RepID=UPI002D79CC54|nr:hypothetical protein [Intrasporangium sp.]HET7400062.1 hypothetical protein [Intrasporangium sp.]
MPLGADEADPEAELRRLVERWRQLPLDVATARLPLVRDHIQGLADRSARLAGHPAAPVPDLGPAVAADQLRVMVHDVVRRAGDVDRADVAARLRGLRAQL